MDEAGMGWAQTQPCSQLLLPTTGHGSHLGHHQDVGEDDGSIQGESSERLWRGRGSVSEGLGPPPNGGPGQAHGAVGSPRAAQLTGATQSGPTQGFSPSPSRRGEGTHRPPGGCSPAASAHSTIWGSGKWQRNPAPPGSPETLQGTSTSVMGCVPGPPCCPPLHASTCSPGR